MVEGGLPVPEVGRRLSVPVPGLRAWVNPESAVGIVMRRRRSHTGKAEAEFWKQEYRDISISKLCRQRRM